MSRLEISVCILLFSVFISSVSQILLKKAADRTYESSLKEYLNPLVIGIFFPEREIYQKKACGICTDSGRRYYIQQDIEK